MRTARAAEHGVPPDRHEQDALRMRSHKCSADLGPETTKEKECGVSWNASNAFRMPFIRRLPCSILRILALFSMRRRFFSVCFPSDSIHTNITLSKYLRASSSKYSLDCFR